MDWEQEREHVVELLFQLLGLELALLWDPPTAQMAEDFTG